jgi:iron complex transport system ATP-binding protein
VIAAESVTRIAGGRRIVDGVSATFEPGKLHVIVGANGAGKSTLLKVLSRHLRADEGVVRYGGRDLRDIGLDALALMRAMLSQSVEISFPLSVRDVVLMGRYPHFTGRPPAHDLHICDEVMRFFDVEAFADRDYRSLSGGEQQRVQFARVLAQVWEGGRPRYLFLDEPVTFLDIAHQFDFMRKVRSLLAPDLTVVGVLHDLNLVAQFADRVLMLRDGKVLADGAVDEVLTPANVERGFGITPSVVRTDEGRRVLVFL